MNRLIKGFATLVVAVVMCAIGVAGCLRGDSPPESSGAVTPTAEPSTPDTAQATVAQWASRVAESRAGIRDAHASWEENQCLPTNVTPICSAYLLTMSMSAEVLALGIEGGTKEGAPGFLGDPPDEIASLVARTHEDARAAADSAGAATDVCQAGECTGEAYAAVADYGSLVATLDAWSPYGV